MSLGLGFLNRIIKYVYRLIASRGRGLVAVGGEGRRSVLARLGVTMRGRFTPPLYDPARTIRIGGWSGLGLIGVRSRLRRGGRGGEGWRPCRKSGRAVREYHLSWALRDRLQRTLLAPCAGLRIGRPLRCHNTCCKMMLNILSFICDRTQYFNRRPPSYVTRAGAFLAA